MNRSILTLSASAFLLATTMGTAQAQSTDDDAMQGQQAEQGQPGDRMKQHHDGKRKYRHRDRHSDMMRRHHAGMGMGQGMMGGGMMGGGMGHRPVMQVMFAMMDADGNGTLSLQEVQDAHARIFAHVDADDDGEVTTGEIKAFFHGKDRRGSSRRDRSEMSDETDDTDDLNLSDDVGDDDNDDNDDN